jgi:ketosteroid isomerase-like protein
MSESEVIERFFAAIEQGDRETIAELYAPDIQVWHSFTGQTVGRDAALEVVYRAIVPGITVTYEEQERFTVADRTARRHLFHAVFPDGAEITIPTAIFLTISDGKIIGFEEYMDSKLVDEATRLAINAFNI